MASDDEDFLWAFDMFERELGNEARPPRDPEDERIWQDYRDAWKIIKERLKEEEE